MERHLSDHDTSPLLVPACRGFIMIGVGPTRGKELLREGRLIARKMGRRTMIETASIRAFVRDLPLAFQDGPTEEARTQARKLRAGRQEVSQ